jgi:hypothetical protein
MQVYRVGLGLRDVRAMDRLHRAAVRPGRGPPGIQIEERNRLRPALLDSFESLVDRPMLEPRRMVRQVMRGKSEGAEAAGAAGKRHRLIDDAAGTNGASGGAEAAIRELRADLAAARLGNARPVFAEQCGIRDQAPRERREEDACHGAAGKLECISTRGFHGWPAHL